LAITIFVLAIYWRGNFFNGFDYSNTGNLINFHAVFMVIGFVLFFGESILCFRVLTVLPKLPVKILHGVFHACNFCLSVAGLAAIFEFYRRILRPGMYSLHSWIGIFAVALYTLQWVASLLAFFIPAVPDSFRSTFKRIHVPLGIILFFTGVSTCLMGITRVNFLDAAYPSLVEPTAYGNALGILLVAYSGFVAYLLIGQGFSREKINEFNIQAGFPVALILTVVMQNETSDKAHKEDDQYAENIGMKCRSAQLGIPWDTDVESTVEFCGK
uniref:Cytochrome b561 domain-containing protein n=1 Tax=Schistocephalus solidus TaxID=70667 RepID=A0A183TMQ9_SCHSO